MASGPNAGSSNAGLAIPAPVPASSLSVLPTTAATAPTYFNPNGKVGIFWDIENCPPPAGMPGYLVVENLRKSVHMFGRIVVFKAYMEIGGAFGERDLTNGGSAPSGTSWASAPGGSSGPNGPTGPNGHSGLNTGNVTATGSNPNSASSTAHNSPAAPSASMAMSANAFSIAKRNSTLRSGRLAD